MTTPKKNTGFFQNTFAIVTALLIIFGSLALQHPNQVGAEACSDYNGNQGNCELAGCTWDSSDCSAFSGDSSICISNGCSYPGNLGECSQYSNSSDCGNNGNCTTNYNNCSAFDGDMGGCTSYSECSWDGGSVTCSGSYFSSCSGNFDTGVCTGSYYPGTCSGEMADTTPPTISEETPVPNPTNDTTPSYTFYTDEVGTISYLGDCSSAVSVATLGSNTISFNTLSDGLYSGCKITVMDASNNVSGELTVSAFTIDTTPPTAPGTPDLQSIYDSGYSESDNITYYASPVFDVTCSSSDDMVYLYDSGTPIGNAACDGSSVSITPSSLLADGVHTLYARSYDPTGNYSTDSDGIAVSIDTGDPEYTSVTPSSGSSISETSGGAIQYSLNEDVYSGSIIIEQNDGIPDGGSPHHCDLVGTALNLGSHNIDLSDTTNGCQTDSSSLMFGSMYNFIFEWIDRAGNSSTVTKTNVTFEENGDTTPPTISFTSPNGGIFIGGSSYPLSVTADDDVGVAGVTYYSGSTLLGSEVTSAPYSTDFDTTPFGDGAYTLYASARDTSNNFATTSVNITIDNTPPSTPTSAPDLDTSVDGGISSTDNITASSDPVFNVKCTTGLRVSIYDEIEPIMPELTSMDCFSNSTTTLETTQGGFFVDGYHILTYTYTDSAGNESIASPSLNFFVDTTAPSIESIVTDKEIGTYGVGEVITITAIFFENVTVGNGFTLTLETGDTDKECVLTAIGSSIATCQYVVEAGDNTANLNVNALSGVITDTAGNFASDSLIVIGSNIADAGSIVIDTTAPSSPSNISATVDGVDVLLEWDNPLDADFDSVTIRRGTSDYPVSVLDGSSVVSNTTGSTYTDAGLSGGVYYYSFFARDNAGNYSSAAHISAEVSVAPGDVTSPTITLSSLASETVSGVFSVSLTASEGIIGLSLSDISIVNAIASHLTSVDSSHYAFDITPISNGLLSLTLPVGAVSDTSDNQNTLASNTLTRTVLFEEDEPVATSSAQAHTASSGSKSKVTLSQLSTIVQNIKVINPFLSPFVFSKTLSLNRIDEEVKSLQKFLNANNYIVASVGGGSVGNETNTFGPRTKLALAKFQKDHHIIPSVGYFGPVTKSYINAILKHMGAQ